MRITETVVKMTVILGKQSRITSSKVHAISLMQSALFKDCSGNNNNEFKLTHY